MKILSVYMAAMYGISARQIRTRAGSYRCDSVGRVGPRFFINDAGDAVAAPSSCPKVSIPIKPSEHLL